MPDQLLASNGCDGVLATRMDYVTWRGDPRYCRLNLQQIIFPGEGGWVTNQQSSCVSMAWSYALTSLAMSGELDILTRSYLPERPCDHGVTTEVDPQSSNSSERRRRMSAPADHVRMSRVDGWPMPSDKSQQDGGSRASGAPARTAHRFGDSSGDDSGDDSVDRLAPPMRSGRRRMSAYADDLSGGEDESEGDGLAAMSIFDFLGLFLAWACMSFVCLVCAYLPRTVLWSRISGSLCTRLRKLKTAPTKEALHGKEVAAWQAHRPPTGPYGRGRSPPLLARGRRGPPPEKRERRATSVFGGLSIADEAGMLRELLRQVAQIHDKMDGTHESTRASVPDMEMADNNSRHSGSQGGLTSLEEVSEKVESRKLEMTVEAI